jgi:hypothetical protein
MAGDEREAGRQRARVLLVVGATEPARLDAKDAVVVAHLGDPELPGHEPAGLLEHESAGRPTHRDNPATNAKKGPRWGPSLRLVCLTAG